SDPATRRNRKVARIGVAGESRIYANTGISRRGKRTMPAVSRSYYRQRYGPRLALAIHFFEHAAHSHRPQHRARAVRISNPRLGRSFHCGATRAETTQKAAEFRKRRHTRIRE